MRSVYPLKVGASRFPSESGKQQLYGIKFRQAGHRFCLSEFLFLHFYYISKKTKKYSSLTRLVFIVSLRLFLNVNKIKQHQLR